MRRTGTIIVLVIGCMAVANCSSAPGPKAASPTTAAPSTTGPQATTAPVPAFIAKFQAQGTKLRQAETVDGHIIFVDDEGRTVYVDDCAVARKVTAQGQKYGPSARDVDGNFTPGFAFMCP